MNITKLLTAGVLALVATAANSSTVFTPTDGDVNFLFGNVAGYDLYMFDDADIGNEAAATSKLYLDVPEKVFIGGPNGGDYTATNQSSQSINLTDSANFFLALWDTTNMVWLRDSNVTSVGTNTYNVAFENQAGDFFVVDVKAQPDVPQVPVPAAVWLFGSGLIGLVGIARRRV